MLALPSEVWKDIEGYEGLYQVSSLGNIKRICDSVTIGMYGQTIVRHRNGDIIKGYRGKRSNDYWRIVLFSNGQRKRYAIHILVYKAFVGEIPEGMQVNHIDENKDNNCVWNLNLLTPKENCNWGTRNERVKQKLTGVKFSETRKTNISNALKGKYSGIKHPNRKRIQQLTKDGELVRVWDCIKYAADELNIGQSNISMVLKGKNRTAGGYVWKYVDTSKQLSSR